MANDRGSYGPPEHKIGIAGKLGLAGAFGLILVGLAGSVMESRKQRLESARLEESDRRRARVAARAYVVKQGIR